MEKIIEISFKGPTVPSQRRLGGGGGEEQDGLPTASLSAIVTETRRITGQLWREETETIDLHHQGLLPSSVDIRA